MSHYKKREGLLVDFEAAVIFSIAWPISLPILLVRKWKLR